jgi:4-amino-4-deoxy-L-arabinose transferase-like glycosyltransferase
MSTAEMIPELTGRLDRGKLTPPEAKPTRPGYVPYLLFILCISIYFLPFMRLLFESTDEGTLVYGAVRILHGQLLGRDFFEVIGPGSFYWLALFFKLFGITFVATRICLFVSSLATALCMYFLARRVCRSYQLLPCILLFATYFWSIWPEISHHVDSNSFALLAVVCMVVWLDYPKTWLLAAAGALIGVTTLILQPKGVLLLLAFLVWLGIQHWRRSTPLTGLVWVIGAWICVVASMLCYFWSQGALHDLIYANVIWPSQNYSTVNTVPYAFRILDHFHQWVLPAHGINWTVGMAAVLFIPFVIVAALPAVVLLLGVCDGVRGVSAEIALYWLAGTAFWLSELHRKDITHLVVGSPLLVILCVFYLQKSLNRGLNLALQTLSIASVCLAGATFIVALVAQPMQTRVGRVHTTVYDPAVAAIEEHVPAGGEIFTYPCPPVYYFLSATTNPTRYSILIYNYNTVSQFEEVIRTLDQHRVKYVLWDKHLEDEIFAKLFPGKLPHANVFEPYLESHYSQVWAHDGVFLMERKNDQPAN